MIEIFTLFLLPAAAVLVLAICAFVTATRASRETRQLREEVVRLRELAMAAWTEKESRLSGRAVVVPPRGEDQCEESDVRQPAAAPPALPRRVAHPASRRESPPPPPPTLHQAPSSEPDQLMTLAESESERVPTERAMPQSKPRIPIPAISLEQFMGAKLFAWLGGLALFLGVVFFVKHSMEQGWISPALRMAIGLIMGAGLVAGGVVMHRRPRYTTLAQTLCATGVVTLYGVSFAAHAIWPVPPFDSAMATFGFMAAVTAAAFTLAVRMKAQVVAVLGMLGGFLAPVLCSTGHDNPFGLWSYIALLCVGTLAVVRHARWHYLVPLAGAATLVMEIGWLTAFWNASGYAHGPATLVPIGVLLGFASLFTLALAWMRKDEQAQEAGALVLCAGAWLAAFCFLGVGSITSRPAVLYTLVLGISALVNAVVWLKPRVGALRGFNAGLGFLHLMLWTTSSLTTELLPWALGLYLIFGGGQTAFAMLCQRRGEGMPGVLGWMPVMMLAHLTLPAICLDEVGLALWPAVLAADALVIGVALATGALAPVLAALVLTLLTVGLWLFRILPGDAASALASFLTVLGGFSVVFMAAGSWLARKRPQPPFAGLLPVSAAVMPFVLLIAATQHLRVADPSPIFGLALVLTIFLLGLARFGGNSQLVPVALGCVLALTWTWHAQGFDAAAPVLPLAWYLGFHVLFTVQPLFSRRAQAALRWPWIASAAAGLGFFGLVHHVVTQAWPNGVMGLLPIGFALPPLALLACVAKCHAPENPARLTQLAWLGGAALFFITLVFPVQFERQWLTLGWALEGAALCWLFRRVPHDGLKFTGAALQVVAFARLALNPELWAGQVRGDTALLNWPLYACSVAALAQFASARFIGPSVHGRWNPNLRSLFLGLGTTLLFLLMNYQIADLHTVPGATVQVLRFGDSFARDMVTTIAWSIFALALLVVGIWRRTAAVRVAGISLLGTSLLKLFLHDLASIGNIHRVGAFVVVAVIALAASYLYQRFLQDQSMP